MSGIIDNTKMGKLKKAAAEEYLRMQDPNPDDPRNRVMSKDPRASKRLNFVHTEEDEERAKYQDHLGNPLPGYKWEGNKIVPIKESTND
jgi:hypothetical protein